MLCFQTPALFPGQQLSVQSMTGPEQGGEGKGGSEAGLSASQAERAWADGRWSLVQEPGCLAGQERVLGFRQLQKKPASGPPACPSPGLQAVKAPAL